MLDHIRFVLCQTSHPGNIGASARAMKTMGLSDLRLVAPHRFPDAQATAMASGADDLLAAARVHDTLDEALTGVGLVAGLTARRRELSQEVLDLREAALILAQQAAVQPVACVFGTEMSGLSNEELSRCQLLITIPANPVYSSLNLAAAVQVAAYELRVATGHPLAPEPPAVLAEAQDVERFYAHLERTLVDLHFLDPAHPKRLMPRLRRLFARARLEKEELNILRGILKSIDQQQ